MLRKWVELKFKVEIDSSLDWTMKKITKVCAKLNVNGFSLTKCTSFDFDRYDEEGNYIEPEEELSPNYSVVTKYVACSSSGKVCIGLRRSNIEVLEYVTEDDITEHGGVIPALMAKIDELKKHEKATVNIAMLMALYESRAENYPEQKQYWDRRIQELDDALNPILAKEATDG